MKNFYKTILTAVLALFAMAANAGTNLYTPKLVITSAGENPALDVPVVVTSVDDYGTLTMWSCRNYENGDYVNIAINTDGTLNTDATSIMTYDYSSETKAVSGTATVTPKEDGSKDLDATITFADDKTYHFTANYIEPAEWPLGAPESVVVTPENITLVWNAEAVSDKQDLTLEGNINIKTADGTVYYGGFQETAAESGKFTCTASLATFMEMNNWSAPSLSVGDQIQVIYSSLSLYSGNDKLFEEDPELDNTVVTVTAEQEPVQEIVLDVVDADVTDTEIWNIYENEDYKVYFDIVKNLPLDPSRTYTLEDMNADYAYLYNKNELVTNQYGTKNWKKYQYTSASVKIGANNELEAEIVAQNGEDVIKGKFVFNNPEVITVSLNGETEYIAEVGAYAVSAKNKGSELKADYVVQFGVKAEAYESKNTFTVDDLTVKGNSVKVAAGNDDKIATANITLTVDGDSQTYTGEIVGESGKKYTINITTNVPTTEAKDITVDFGATLLVSADDGDIKLKAQNAEHQFIGYITCATTDVPSGTYNLLSYSKYGDYNSTFNMYMSDGVEDGKVAVVNEAGVISITATFKQGGNNYTIKASTGSTGINSIEAGAVKAVSKYLENGKIVILKNGKKYGVDAVEVK